MHRTTIYTKASLLARYTNNKKLLSKSCYCYHEKVINQKQAIKIYKAFSKKVLVNEQWYKDISPFVAAVLLYGSVAKGVNRSNSDIDILLIVPLAIEEKFTAGEYIYQFDTHEINIVLRSVEKIRRIADEQKDTFQKEVFRDTVIIDSSKEVEHLLARISNITLNRV